HGQFYLDSDKLNDYLHFRNDGFEYFYQLYLDNLGSTATILKILTKLPGGQKFIGGAMKERFRKLSLTERGTMNFIENKRTDFIDPFFISESEWHKTPNFSEFQHFEDWNTVIPIGHGYDEGKSESQLTIGDMKGAAEFRGGRCLSDSMLNGDMTSKLTWKCAFGHEFQASPRLVLEGGHWCPQCERESWNYHEIAKVNPFFAQVWYPLYDKNEPAKVYPKIVTELDVI
ncbi:MAG TPA: NAD(P)-dependent oxidoreductase, partial [Bacillota bacterium]|nr:NAD(P)-dependent oxidoreductase [Bacillota bacterium]